MEGCLSCYCSSRETRQYARQQIRCPEARDSASLSGRSHCRGIGAPRTLGVSQAMKALIATSPQAWKIPVFIWAPFVSLTVVVFSPWDWFAWVVGVCGLCRTCSSLLCPRCRAPWLWIGISQPPALESDSWLWGLRRCPHCGLESGEDRSPCPQLCAPPLNGGHTTPSADSDVREGPPSVS